MKHDKVIFLDCDGVLNSIRFDNSNKSPLTIKINNSQPEDWRLAFIDPDVVQLLNTITEKTGAVYVLSSSWRNGATLERIQRLFSLAGLTGKFIGLTPVVSGLDRGHEIKAWLDENYYPKNFAIIDDDWAIEPFLDHHVKTYYHSGFLPEHVPEVFRILGHYDV